MEITNKQDQLTLWQVKALRAYLETAIWSESCYGLAAESAHDCRGEDCDTSLLECGYSADDVDMADGFELAWLDLINFCRDCLLEEIDIQSIDPAQFGHDFWLTRNHHGAGFWDRGYGPAQTTLGDRLTKLCKPYGEASLEVGPGDKLYHIG